MRFIVVALLGRPTSPLLEEALLLVIVLPVLESITLPELSMMRVLDPDVALLSTDELLALVALLLYALDDLPLSPVLLTAVLEDPLALERPTLDCPLAVDLYAPELLPDLLLLSPE